MKRIILHIGRHKSGTTSLQKSFLQNRKKLLEAGIYYPKEAMREYAHHPLSEALSSREVRIKGDEVYKKKIVKDFLNEIGNVKQNYILISSEGFQNCRPQDIKRLFEGYEVTVIFYIRNQISYLKSAFLQEVHATNYKETIEVFESNFPVDYYMFVRAWADSFENIIPNIFSRKDLLGGDVVVDFWEKIIIKYFGFSIIYEQPEFNGFTKNVSLKGSLILFKLRMNRLTENDVSQYPGLYQSIGILSEKESKSISLISPELRDKVVSKYSKSNSLLTKEYELSDLEMDNVPEKVDPLYLGPLQFYEVLLKLIQEDERLLSLKNEFYFAVTFENNKNVYFEFSEHIHFDSLSHLYLNNGEQFIKLCQRVKESKRYFLPKDVWENEKKEIFLKLGEYNIKLALYSGND
ncbi:hypothetical protein AADZ84_11065 [Colwelliaceae bacterium MEBiC 14330]